MSVAAVVLGALAGVLAAVAAEPIVRRLPAGIDERLPQPAWARRLGRPPAMELVGGVLGAACGARFGLEAPLVPALLLCALLVPVTAIDLEWRVIPNAIVLPGALAGLLVGSAVDPGRAGELVGGAVLGFAIFLALALISPAGLGLGDVKLVLMLGAFLGWAVLPAMVVALLLAAVPSLAILARRGLRAGRGVGIPFGPFLAAGGAVALLWGGRLVDAYTAGL